MDSVVDNYVLVDSEMQTDLEQIEQAVFSGNPEVDAQTIYRLKREVLEFGARRCPSPRPCGCCTTAPAPPCPARRCGCFRDVADHLLRVNDHVESYDRLLTDMLTAHLAQLSVQQAQIRCSRTATCARSRRGSRSRRSRP